MPCSGAKFVLPQKDDFFLSAQTSGESKAGLHYISIFLARRKEGENQTCSQVWGFPAPVTHTWCAAESLALRLATFSPEWKRELLRATAWPWVLLPCRGAFFPSFLLSPVSAGPGRSSLLSPRAALSCPFAWLTMALSPSSEHRTFERQALPFDYLVCTAMHTNSSTHRII